MKIIVNIPEFCDDGLSVGGLCISWLLFGLILGTVLLAGWNLLRATRQQGRRLDDSQEWPTTAGVPSPRVSVVRLIPMAETPRS